MTSISSISGMTTLTNYASVKNTQKADASSLADQLFEKLDSKKQGFIDKSELQAALTPASGTSTSADKLFAQMDADSDGKITKQEMASTMQSMLEQVDNLAAKMRFQDGMGGPAETGGDKGFSKDELLQIAADTSESDSKRSAFLSKVAENFDKADADSDGKVTRDEAMSFAQSIGEEMGGPSSAGGARPAPPPGGAPGGGAPADAVTDSSSSSDPADTDGDGTVSAKEALSYLLAQLDKNESDATIATNSEDTANSSAISEKIARQIMQLVQAYGGNNSLFQGAENSLSSSLSVSA